MDGPTLREVGVAYEFDDIHPTGRSLKVCSLEKQNFARTRIGTGVAWSRRPMGNSRSLLAEAKDMLSARSGPDGSKLAHLKSIYQES